MSAHSTAPWQLVPFDENSGYGNSDWARFIVMSGGSEEYCIATLIGDISTIPAEANARLIAAAPELLAALTLLLDRHVELVSCGDCGNWDVEREEAVIAARAALSKAEAT